MPESIKLLVSKAKFNYIIKFANPDAIININYKTNYFL